MIKEGPKLLLACALVGLVFTIFTVDVYANGLTLPLTQKYTSGIGSAFGGAFGVNSFFDHDSSSNNRDRFDGADLTSSCVLGETCYEGHKGIDFNTGSSGGKPVVAAARGKVRHVGWDDPNNHGYGLGYYVRIWHYPQSYSFSTVYGHLQSASVSVDQWKERGASIASSGCSGNCTGPHLHFGVYNGNGYGGSFKPMDPFGWWVGSIKDPYYYNRDNLWSTTPPARTYNYNQNFYVYTPPQEDGDPASVTGHWDGLDKNKEILSVDGAEVNSAYTGEEIFILRSKTHSDQNLYVYSQPTSCGASENQIAGDWWSSDGGTIAIAVGNFDSDGGTEVAYMKYNGGTDYNLEVFNAPTYNGDNGSKTGGDYWSFDGGDANDVILDIARVPDMNGNGRDEIAVLTSNQGDHKLYIYPPPQGNQNTSPIASTAWDLPNSGSYRIIGGNLTAASGGYEIGVLKRKVDSSGSIDVNYLVYDAPTSLGDSSVPLIAWDYWNIPSSNNGRSIGSIGWPTSLPRVGILKDGGSSTPGCP